MSSNSGYDGREPDSQVRSIIKQLNEERPSKEKSREVVVRPDGTKVIRVVKKRKVMISGEEKARKSKRRFLYLVLALFVLGGAVAAFFAMKMSMMSGDSYIQERQEALKEAWNAKSVRCVGARVSGFMFTADSLVVEFPESSMIESVEMKNISAQLSSASFFSGILQGDELTVESASLRVREGVEKLALSGPSGKELWKFKRISCPKFTLTIGDEYTSPLSVKQSSAYIYSPGGSKTNLVVVLEGGHLQLQGWDDANIVSGKILVSPAAMEDFMITCTMPAPDVDNEDSHPKFVISGSVKNGAKLSGPYKFSSRNLPFGLLSGNRFSHFLTASTNELLSGGMVSDGFVTLPFHEKLSFYGKFAVKDVALSTMPALRVLDKHIYISHNHSYEHTTIRNGVLELQKKDGGVNLVISNLTDPEKICLKGTAVADAEGNLSGSMEYGIPVSLARAEYKDNLVDRVFSNDDGRYAWLVTTLSGTANAPADDAAELDKAAEPSREERVRTQNVDSVVDRLSRSDSSRRSGWTETTETKTTTPAVEPEPVTPTTPETPSEPETPGDAGAEESTPSIPGLQLPSDDFFKTGNGSGGHTLPSDDFFSSGSK